MAIQRVKLINKSPYPNPSRQTAGSSGYDLRANIDAPVRLEMGRVSVIPTGVYLEVPEGLEGQVRARSGLASRHGVALVNGVGTVDSDYRGEVKVVLTCLASGGYTVSPGERIAQLVFAPVVFPEIELLDGEAQMSPTERGGGGFGHSGKN